jgi:possible homing endonuclease
MQYSDLEMNNNDWQSIEIYGHGYMCKCQCGNIELHTADDLMYDKVRMCKDCVKHNNSERQRDKLEGKKFGKWIVKNYVGNHKYRCTCLGCNQDYNIASAELKRGRTLKCKECSGTKLKDLKGKQFGHYKVIEYVGNHYWKCECMICHSIKNVASQHLTLDKNEKCINCSNKENGLIKLHSTIQDNLAKHYGNLVVTGYNYETNKYICECQCNNKTKLEVSRSNLLTGHTKSCGCISKELKNKAMLERYGDIASKRINNPRNIIDIYSLMDKDEFLKRYNTLQNKLGRVPTSLDVSSEFDVTTPIALRYAHTYGVNINTDTGAHSKAEDDICNILASNRLRFNRHVRNIIHPQELDIYIPDKKIAIEFNGSYWHSTLYVDKYYHQNKTLECAKKHIRLIHIFEHEWYSDNHSKIINMLNTINNTNRIKIRASKLNTEHISAVEAKEFLDKFHLQNNIFSEIRLGLKYENELAALMTFGKPRFNSSYEYELVRFCVKPEYNIYGAASKLFKYFINNYKPKSVLAYSDISKFTGNTYLKLGFKCTINDITEPNYIWVNSVLKTLSRYQTQKHILLEKGIGTEDQTEDEILHSMGYYKVYNSGNLRLYWNKEETT